MKRFLPPFSVVVLLVSAAVLLIAFQLWRDAREERIRVEVARQFAEASVVEARALKDKAEAAAERSRDARLAGPAAEDGWDFSGTALSDDAWKLTGDKDHDDATPAIPRALPEDDGAPGFPPPTPPAPSPPGGP